MIIKQLNIYGYGRWIDQQIEIQNPLQIIYGPNEAGKSTIIAFIKGILFGFTDKKHSLHGQYTPKGNAPYGGEIIFSANDHSYKVVRTGLKYGGTVKFYDLDNDVELTEDDYHQLIDPIDRTAYDQLFYFGSIDQNALYKMGRDELRMRIQSIGVAGAGDWMDLQADLEKQSAKMYAPRGRTKTINVQISDYKKLADQVSAAKDNFPHYQDLQSQLRTNQVNLNKLQTQLQAANQSLDDQRHLQTVLPLVAQLNDLKDVNASQVKPKFENDDLNDFNKLNMALSAQQRRVSEVQRVVDELAAKVSKTPVQTFYEAHRESINELVNELPKMRRLAVALEMGQAQLEEVQQQIQAQTAGTAKNAQGALPQPFDEQTLTQVNDLIRDEQNVQDKLSQATPQRSQTHDEPSKKSGLIWYGVAGALVVLSFILGSNSFSWIGYVLAIVAAGWGWYSAKAISQPQPTPTDEDPVELNKQLAQIHSKLAAIQNQFGLQGIDELKWLSIQTSLQQIVRLQESYSKQKLSLDENQSEYDTYVAKWQFASDWLKFDPSNYSATIETINNAVEHWQQLSADYQRQQTALDSNKQTLKDAKAKLDGLTKQKTDFFKVRNVGSDADFQQQVEFQTNLAKKLEQKATLESQIKSAKVAIPTNVDQATIDATVHDQAEKVQNLQDQLNDLSREATQVKTEIDGLIKNGDYYDLRQQLANQQTEIVENVQKYMALKLSSQWIQAVLNVASKGRLPKTLTLAKQYFATLTNNAYKDIIFKNEISVVREDDVHFPINELSTGTLEQLYLALIFSMAVGFSDQYPMPIMIDDGFVNFDKARKEAANTMLKQVSQKTQVLYFTANLDANTDDKLVLDLKTL